MFWLYVEAEQSFRQFGSSPAGHWKSSAAAWYSDSRHSVRRDKCYQTKHNCMSEYSSTSRHDIGHHDINNTAASHTHTHESTAAYPRSDIFLSAYNKEKIRKVEGSCYLSQVNVCTSSLFNMLLLQILGWCCSSFNAREKENFYLHKGMFLNIRPIILALNVVLKCS